MGHCIQVMLYGVESSWKVAKDVASRVKGPLKIRVQVIVPWMQWLKDMGNPYFADARIPVDDVGHADLQQEMNQMTE